MFRNRDGSSRKKPPLVGFGDLKFAFAQWETPFQNNRIIILECHWTTVDVGDPDKDLVARVIDHDTRKIYKLTFSKVSGMRLLDEGGLTEYWHETAKAGGRPGLSSFMVRNSQWVKDSFLMFLKTDGWSYILATETNCLEVAGRAPKIELESQV